MRLSIETMLLLENYNDFEACDTFNLYYNTSMRFNFYWNSARGYFLA